MNYAAVMVLIILTTGAAWGAIQMDSFHLKSVYEHQLVLRERNLCGVDPDSVRHSVPG